jgi:hypothetical protein
MQYAYGIMDSCLSKILILNDMEQIWVPIVKIIYLK